MCVHVFVKITDQLHSSNGSLYSSQLAQPPHNSMYTVISHQLDSRTQVKSLWRWLLTGVASICNAVSQLVGVHTSSGGEEGLAGVARRTPGCERSQ